VFETELQSDNGEIALLSDEGKSALPGRGEQPSGIHADAATPSSRPGAEEEPSRHSPAVGIDGVVPLSSASAAQGSLVLPRSSALGGGGGGGGGVGGGGAAGRASPYGQLHAKLLAKPATAPAAAVLEALLASLANLPDGEVRLRLGRVLVPAVVRLRMDQSSCPTTKCAREPLPLGRDHSGGITPTAEG